MLDADREARRDQTKRFKFILEEMHLAAEAVRPDARASVSLCARGCGWPQVGMSMVGRWFGKWGGY